MADPTFIEQYIPSTIASVRTAISRIGEATKWVTLEIAPGNYDVTKLGTFQVGQEYGVLLSSLSRVRIRAKGGGQVTFTIPTSDSVASPCNGFILNACTYVEFDGIRFVGTAENDANNYRAAVYIKGATQHVRFKSCDFENCAPVLNEVNALQRGVTMSDCTVKNACRSISLPDYSRVRGCFFENDTFIAPTGDADGGPRSHAIYVYGNGAGVVIDGNHFLNISKSAIKFKGNSSDLERKSEIVFCNNSVTHAQYGFEVGSSTEILHTHVHCYDNSFHNVSIAVYGFSCSTANLHDNTITCDWTSNFTTHVGVYVRLAGTADAGAIASTTGINIHHNVIRNLSGYVAVLQVDGVPTAGQTVTLDGTVYTFVSGAAAAATEITVGSTATAAKMAQRIADTIRGKAGSNVYSFPAKNAAIDSPNDVQIEETTATPQRVIISCPASFTLATDGTNLSITTTPTDYRRRMTTGIKAQFVRGLVIDHNQTWDCVAGWDVIGCIEPTIAENRVNGWVPEATGPWAVRTFNCSKPRLGVNRFSTSRMTVDNANRRWDISDGFPIIDDQIGLQTWTGTTLRTYLMGRYGHQVPIGDGVAHTFIWMGLFGVTLLAGSAGTAGVTPGIFDYIQNDPYTWKDGNTIVLTSAGGTPYTCTFTRVAGTASSANTWNTKAEFIAWVNAQTGGNFIADDPDSLSYGYVRIKHAVAGVATAGTTGNSATIVVTTKSELNGIVLTPSFKGGHATAGRTVFWTPLAQVHRPLFVQPDNDAADALTGSAGSGVPYAASSDTVAGACYVVRHSNSVSGEQFKVNVA